MFDTYNLMNKEKLGYQKNGRNKRKKEKKKKFEINEYTGIHSPSPSFAKSSENPKNEEKKISTKKLRALWCARGGP